MAQIELANITHYYNGVAALTDVSLSIEEKKVTAIIGKSGSGKSTLLQVINGLVRPRSGKVTVFDSILNYKALEDTRLKIGYVVQGAALFPHMTVEENITVPARIKEETSMAIRGRVQSLMALVRLPLSYLEKYPHELSGGEQQRVSICRALLLNPPVLLMDEPFGSLDPVTRHEIYDEVIQLQVQEPRTIIMVTHDMREARHLGDFIAVLHQGKLQQYGSASEIIDKPANQFVQELIEATLT